MDNLKSVSLENIKEYRNNYENNVLSKAMTNAMAKSGFYDVCYSTENAKKMNHKFSIEVPTLPATDQKSSSRCWIFASLNVLREKVAKKLNLANFELSQNFVSFYDHIEKANYFLEGIIETADRPLDDRTVTSMLSCPVEDGGWWDMFVNICKKYGVVPQEAMPETSQSNNTAPMNMVINKKIREDAMIIRNALAEGKSVDEVRAMKDGMLNEIYNVVSICMGNPPEKFDFEYVDKDNNYHADRGLTPHEFFDKYIGGDLDDIITIEHAPIPSRPFHKIYEVAHAGNVVGGKPVTFFNVTMDELKAAVIKQLQAGETIWFTCDCFKDLNNEEGIWDTAMYDYATPFGLKFNMTKAEMMDYRQSSPLHAMTITGVNLVDGKPDKWKIQNSWGTKRAKEGYYVMSDDFFDKYTYVACVDKKYLTEDEVKLLDQEHVMVDMWDPIV